MKSFILLNIVYSLYGLLSNAVICSKSTILGDVTNNIVNITGHGCDSDDVLNGSTCYTQCEYGYMSTTDIVCYNGLFEPYNPICYRGISIGRHLLNESNNITVNLISPDDKSYKLFSLIVIGVICSFFGGIILIILSDVYGYHSQKHANDTGECGDDDSAEDSYIGDEAGTEPIKLSNINLSNVIL